MSLPSFSSRAFCPDSQVRPPVCLRVVARPVASVSSRAGCKQRKASCCDLQRADCHIFTLFTTRVFSPGRAGSRRRRRTTVRVYFCRARSATTTPPPRSPARRIGSSALSIIGNEMRSGAFIGRDRPSLMTRGTFRSYVAPGRVRPSVRQTTGPIESSYAMATMIARFLSRTRPRYCRIRFDYRSRKAFFRACEVDRLFSLSLSRARMESLFLNALRVQYTGRQSVLPDELLLRCSVGTRRARLVYRGETYG